MRIKLKQFFGSWKEILYAYPIEIGLSILFILSTFIYYEAKIPLANGILYYSSILFFLTFFLNGWSKKEGNENSNWKRIIYFLSLFTFLLLNLWHFEWNSFSTTYMISFIILFLLNITNLPLNNNQLFIQKFYQLSLSIFIAILFSGIVFLIVLSIYDVIWSLFDLQNYSIPHSSRRYQIYMAGLIFGGILPWIFLYFTKEKDLFNKHSKTLEILFRFILAPALFIYTVIFYLYFIRIIINWSLPKGNVCYITAVFIFMSYLLKGIRMLLNHPYYDRYFKQISWINLPTLILYWISTFYRIHEYGWTEMRVYLVVTGAIMTLLILLFFKRNGKQFLICSWFAIGILALTTYIPGISAKDIEKISQTSRNNFPLHLNTKENIHINLYEHFDEYQIGDYQTLHILHLDFNDNPNEINAINHKDSIVLKISPKNFLAEQFRKNGLTLYEKIPEDVYPSFLSLKTDSTLILFEHIKLQRVSPQKEYEISFFGNIYYFKK